MQPTSPPPTVRSRPRPRVLSVGEVLWDVLPEGPKLGGAPANFAFHAHALGGEAALVSRIGDDALGQEILNCLHVAGLRTDLVQMDDTHDTGTVHVEVGPGGQPRYHIIGDVACDHLQATPAALAAAANAEVICFGTLAQRSDASRAAIRQLVCATPETAWRICDINLREPFALTDVVEESVAIANVLKLNDTELPVIARALGVSAHGDAAVLSQIALHGGLNVIALTRGERGSLLWADGVVSEHRGLSTPVQDTIGAGDAFTAALAIGLVTGWSLDVINARANEVASFVCSQAGATPELPGKLMAAFA
jgi:fructokinase